jgi:hypothetical protein
MKLNKVKSLIMVAMLGLITLGGVGTTTAEAQRRGGRPIVVYRSYWGPRWGWGWRDPFWGPTVTVVNPIAMQRETGYSDGHHRGKDDAKDGKANSPESHKHFNKSDSQTYRQAFLQGYADGYREAMNGRG